MQIRRVLVFRKYNKKESGCPSVTAAFHNGAVCLPGSESQQILNHECQQLMKSTVPRLKRPFIPGVPGWGLAWTYQGAARVNTARLAARTHIPVAGLPWQPAVGPSQCWLFPGQSALIYRTSPSPGSSGSFLLSLPQFCLQLDIFPKVSPPLPPPPPFKQRRGCNSPPRTARSFCPPTLAVRCPYPTGRHTNTHCTHIWMGTPKS